MQLPRSGLSSDSPQKPDATIQAIIEFWNGLRICDESIATTWEVLGSLESRVTECLYRKPPDIDLAESLTAKAALLIAGFTEL